MQQYNENPYTHFNPNYTRKSVANTFEPIMKKE